ncbi:hypothetical protein, partial [Klebsiella pneumoniae]|uniref:hypothetical protein n=1 Tax=Klebsiella pneumoniae TaxID=573 RepID=UPI001D0D6023
IRGDSKPSILDLVNLNVFSVILVAQKRSFGHGGSILGVPWGCHKQVKQSISGYLYSVNEFVNSLIYYDKVS